MNGIMNFNEKEAMEMMSEWVETDETVGLSENDVIYVVCSEKLTTDGRYFYEPWLADAALWPGHSNRMMCSKSLITVQKRLKKMPPAYILPVTKKVYEELMKSLDEVVAHMYERILEAANCLQEYSGQIRGTISDKMFEAIMNDTDGCVGDKLLTEEGEIISTEGIEFVVQEDFPMYWDDEEEYEEEDEEFTSF